MRNPDGELVNIMTQKIKVVVVVHSLEISKVFRGWLFLHKMSNCLSKLGPNEHATIYFGPGNTSRIIINGKDMNDKARRVTKLQVFADGELWETVDANAGLNIEIHAESVNSVQTASGDVILHDATKVDRVNTMSGSVRFEQDVDCSGTINTMSGSVTARSIRANKINTMSGDIRGISK